MESFESQPKPEESQPISPVQEKKSTISRVVGSDQESNRIMQDGFEKIFKNQELWDDLEREKTPEELEVINQVLSELSEFAHSYGASIAPVTPDHVHLIDGEKLARVEGDDYETFKEGFKRDRAYISLIDQAIVVFSSKINSKSALATILSHELIHAHSFRSLTAKPVQVEGQKKIDLDMRRAGMEIASGDGKETYFTGIEEAIVSELQKKFYNTHIRNLPILAEEQRQTEEIRKELNEGWPEDAEEHGDICYAWVADDGMYDYELITYPKERKFLHTIMQDILEKFPDRFASKEDIFKEFVVAHATGKLLNIAKLIDETYKDKKVPVLEDNPETSYMKVGKGGVEKRKRPFRILAENTKKRDQ